ncbi:MAG: sulfonate transport system substrate-binding protein [Alphaproteobacteria bacterium]|nr:sulfonate transport system substrate-binding protein [Alphaproteobacteria bacterium]
MIRRALACAALCVGGAPLHAQTAPHHAQPAEEVTMAVPAVGFPFVAGYVADRLNLWEKHGLKVRTIVIAGIGSTNAVISGSAEFAQVSALSLTRAAASGQRLLAILTTTDRPITEISIRKDVADAADFDPKAPLEKRAQILKGHSFAIGGVNTVVHAYLRIVAAIGGLDPESIRVAPLAGDSMLAGMQTRAVDGMSAVLPWTRKGTVDGSSVLVASGAEGDPPHLSPLAFNVVAARLETCERRRSLCEKIGRAFAEAMAFIRRDARGTLAILKKTFANFEDAVLADAIEVVRKSTPASPAVTAEMFANAENFNVEARLMKAEAKLKSYDGLFTDAYVK